MQDKEIELKFIITQDIKDNIIKDLTKLNLTPKTTHQIDTYYIPDFREFEINGETMECVRIRQTDKGKVLCYKKIHRESTPVYCDEYEVSIDSKEQMEKILFALGFSIQMVIDKTRVSYSYNNFSFDFDTIKDVAELLEVELKDNSASTDTILDFVSKYGLTQQDATYDGIQVIVKRSQNQNNVC